jgi:hypothetical protein
MSEVRALAGEFCFRIPLSKDRGIFFGQNDPAGARTKRELEGKEFSLKASMLRRKEGE